MTLPRAINNNLYSECGSKTLHAAPNFLSSGLWYGRQSTPNCLIKASLPHAVIGNRTLFICLLNVHHQMQDIYWMYITNLLILLVFWFLI